MIVAAALAMLVAAVPTPAVDALVVTSVDSSAYPQVVVDFVLPERFAAIEVTAAMVSVDGAPAASAVPVDPTGVVVSFVVDDSPAVPAEVVGASQGGAIELVRSIDAGTRVAVATPSGLQTAFTADPGATIARIAGIIAGAPAVTPLPQLILDAAAALGTTDTPDRHLVVVLGGPLGASEEQLSQLATLVASDGITLHLVGAAGAADPALVPIAVQSGGSVPIAGETLASYDAITVAISNRYRVTTTVGSPGDHTLALTMNGETIQAVVTVPPPSTTPDLASSPPVPSATVADEDVPNSVDTNATPTTVEAAAPADATALPDDDPSPLTVASIALMVALFAVASVYIVLGLRRQSHADVAGTDETKPVAPAFAEPLTTKGAHFYRVIESESMPAIPDVVPDPESAPTTEFKRSPGPEPDPEPAAKFVPHEHEPVPESEPVPVPESEREPEPEPEPEPVTGARPTPAHWTRGRRSEPTPARVAAEPGAEPEWLVAGNLRFCPASGEVSSGRYQVHLDPQEVAILELLMTSGHRGVTQDDIVRAGNLDPAGRDVAPMLARIRRKTGTRSQMVRRERVTVYIFDDDVESDAQGGARRPARPPARR